MLNHVLNQVSQQAQMRMSIIGLILRHRQHQSEEQDASPPAFPNTTHQPQLDVDADKFRMENPVQMFMDNNTSDTQELTQTVQPADRPNVQENDPFDTQPRRSQREKRSRETLTDETCRQFGRASHKPTLC